jgi:hypothetical protein
VSKRPGGQLGRIWKLEVNTSSFMRDEDLQVVRKYCASGKVRESLPWNWH